MYHDYPVKRKGWRPEQGRSTISLSPNDWLSKFVKDYPSANSERLDRLYKALPEAVKMLTPLQQEVIHEIYALGRTQTQVADRRGVNKSTICRMHQRALKRLRNHLQLLF